MLRLLPHPDCTTHSIDNFQIGFSVSHSGHLRLRYHVDCEPSFLALAVPEENIERADELWKSTCFEAFVKKPDESSYLELNFSTARKWATYSFENYRSGMRNQRLSEPPEIYLDGSASHIALEANVQLPGHYVGQPLDMAITAIIDEKDGLKSHWALAHPPGEPDFHHQACFAVKLAPPVIP